MRPAIFLDRDGVLIENRDEYVRTWSDVVPYASSMRALGNLKDTPYKVVVVTNQSAVGRGLIPLSVAEGINARMLEMIEAAGGRVDAVFMCPHAPQDRCDCRKPQPGLFFQAAEALDLDLPASIMVGDALTDLQAARAAGIGTVALVLTGRGSEQARLARAPQLAPFAIYTDLAEALHHLLSAPPGEA